LSPISANTGATLTSFTVTVMVSQSEKTPSVTQMVNVKDCPPSNSPGVQAKTPVVESILAFVGAPIRLKVKVWPSSSSVAKAVNVNNVPSYAVLLPMGASTGASFTSMMRIENTSS